MQYKVLWSGLNGKQCKEEKSRVGSDVHPDSPCLLLQHSALQFVASHPVLFPHSLLICLIHQDAHSQQWVPELLQKVKKTMRLTGKHCKLSSLTATLDVTVTLREIRDINSGILVINCMHLYKSCYWREIIWTSRIPKIFHHSSMKLLLFPDLDLFTVSNQDFPHTLHFLNSEVSLCKLNQWMSKRRTLMKC